MIFAYIIAIICHMFLSGMLTSAILVNRAEGRPSDWKLWACAPICFLFGIYNIVALIGYEVNQCSGS